MEFERVDNLCLLENSLSHILCEIERHLPLYFRVAKESHLVLYRAMVEALRGTAKIQVTGRSADKKKVVHYKIGEEPWCKIEKVKIEDCKHAWRYSAPLKIDNPPLSENNDELFKPSDFLKGFYELIAKVQTVCFMCQYVNSKPIQITNDDMLLLEWLHEQIRNEFEHFVPKLYSVHKEDLINSSALCLELSFKLLFESHNIIPSSDITTIKQSIEKSLKRLKI